MMKIKPCCNFELDVDEKLVNGDMIIFGKHPHLTLCVKNLSGDLMTIPNCPHCKTPVVILTT